MKTIFLSLALALLFNLSFALAPAQIDSSVHPTMGDLNAPVQVVAFLEPKCPDSKRYNNQSFPKLQAEFIDSKKIRYTVITTSFLPQSMPAAIALLSAYYQEPDDPHSDLFFKYLNTIYLNQPPERENWATLKTLQKFAAEASAKIDQNQLKNAIAKKLYRSKIDNNTIMGNLLMGRLSTPTIYVDGLKVENRDNTIDYGNLKRAIVEALQKQSR